MNDDKNGARGAGDERDDEPSPSEIVWSLSQEYKAQVAKWAQFSVKQVQDYEQVQRAIAAAVAAAAAADTATEKARQAIPKGMLDLTPYAQRATQIHEEAKRIAEQLSRFGSAPVGYYPPNWWSVPQLDGDAATAIMQDEGIPLAWVPGAEIVADLTAPRTPPPGTRSSWLGRRRSSRTVASGWQRLLTPTFSN